MTSRRAVTTRRAATRRAVTALALAAALLPVGASAGVAAAYDDALAHAWAGPTVELAWDGTTYTTATTSFVGDQVVVPGDVAGRTLTVRNDGPTDATLRGWVTDVRLRDPGAADVHHATGQPQGDFYADLTLRWRTASQDGAASFRALAAVDRTPVVEVPLAAGESTAVTLVTALPVSATSGNTANVAPREAVFDVLLRLDGTPADGVPDDGGAGDGGATGTAPGGGVPATPAGDRAGVGAAAGWGSGPLATTGADALRVALAAVVAVGTGGLLLAAARRRRRHEER